MRGITARGTSKGVTIDLPVGLPFLVSGGEQQRRDALYHYRLSSLDVVIFGVATS